MKKFSYPLSALLLIALLIGTSACSNGDNQDQNNEDEKLVIPVEVSNVSRGNISAYYANTATLEAEQEATVVARVRGIVREIYVEEGDQVKAGQVIAKIEDDQYRIEAARAKATLDRLQNDFQRNKELYEKNLIAAEAYQNSQYEFESQKAAYELAQLNLEHTSIKSPISGVISERYVKVGNMIGTDQQVYRVTDFSPLQAILHIPEHEMAKIRKDQRTELRVDALPNQTFLGHVERISPVVDSETGTFKVTIFVDETKDMLRPGMFGRVKIVYDTRENTRMIPKSAVMSQDLAQSVYVIKDSLAFKKQIRTGYVNGMNIEVIDGLEDGEMVVTIGQGSLQDSSKVNVITNL
ncbi:MAG: efflux transporter periplasmic adaptor subunit [Balneola sp.]|mgnify:CR=1 FL=1|jgi:RND family efflux transporter MFP subunit|nr:efflux transporter periplasmic adaptor subunit [Balneola sp.]MBE80386.1 efflux transporter periplasmic adaptor subunit [Balneola sp.]|tara:strand:+ start:56056 stop:57111 length:1056 start_codon:yes stop_codon:yes gene_type:complete